MNIKVGLCSVTFRNLNTTKILNLASKAKIHGIEWGSDVHVPCGDYKKADKIREESLKLNIFPASYGSYIHFGEKDYDYDKYIKTTLTLGASNIRVWAGRLGVPSNNYTNQERIYVIDEIKRFCEKAFKYNLVVSLEYHPNTLTDSISSTLSIFKDLDNDNLFTYWQANPGIKQLNCLNELKLLKNKLSNLHIFQLDENKIRYPLYAGRDVWIERFKSITKLKNKHDDRYAFLEFVLNDSIDQFLKDSRTLKDIISKLG